MLSALLIAVAICFLLGVPVGFALGIAAAVCVMTGNIPATLIPQRMVAGISFPQMAVPFFMLAGAIMEKGGVSRKIVEFSDALLGHIKGGLAAVTILASTFFAAISGSATATAAAVGGITIPEMEKRKYDRSYSAAVVASGGCLGTIIPPSIPMVIYGLTSGMSISKLLIGGIVPGVILALLLLVVNHIMSKKHNYPASPRKSGKEVWKAFKNAIWALLMPIIILGGILTGVFTPTESACIAVVYGLIVSFFVYKELKLKDLPAIFFKATVNSAMVMLLIAAANPFGWLMTANQVSVMFSNWLLGITNSLPVILLMIMILYLVLGCLMETSSIILLVVPMVAPIVASFGYDMLAFGVITVINLSIGMLTPPVGVALFTACSVANVDLNSVIKKVIPFLLVMILGLILFVVFPQICSFLPNALM